MEGTATRTESLLRPREIQVRIRSGQTPETVAAAAQTTVERVMVFATPVLAERAFVAQQAVGASVRRRVGDGPVGLLGDSVARRLEAAGLDPESADWDAWRRDDGRWTVVATYAEAGETRRAEFTYDAMGRYVVAEDEASRWLVGERRAVDPAPASAQLALGDDALRVVTGQPLSAVLGLAQDDLAQHDPAQVQPQHQPEVTGRGAPDLLRPVAEAPAADEPTEDLTETARAVRAVAAPEPPPAEGEVLFEDEGLRAPTDVVERRVAQPSVRPRTRRSMPSWDDIMLGSAPRGD